MSINLTFSKRLALLTAVPIIVLLLVGGAFFLRLRNEYAEITSDIRAIESYRGIMATLNAAYRELAAERNLALRVAVGTGSEADYRRQISLTDVKTAAIPALIASLPPEVQAGIPADRLKNITDGFSTLIPDTRNDVLSGKAAPVKIMGNYTKPMFNGLYIPDAYRAWVKTANALNFLDGLFIINKTREIESMMGSFFLIRSLGYTLRGEDLTIIRKQYFASVEADQYLRRFFPKIRETYDAALRTDPISVAYVKNYTDLSTFPGELNALPAAPKELNFQQVVSERYALFLQTLDQGYDIALASLHSTANIKKQNLTLLFAAVLAGLLLSIVACVVIGNKTKGHLASISQEINVASNDVQAASNQLTSASSQIAENASSYAAALEEISASLKEVTEVARANEKHTTQADQLARQATGSVTSGLATVDQLSHAMESVKGSGDRITQIISRINDISFQTNILALNAAVEAARAGTAGAGFSVVADEVRQLAQRCAQAAAETTTLIEESSRNTQQAISTAEAVTKTFKAIASDVHEVGGLVGEISKNFHQQAQSIANVDSAVNAQDNVAQSNAAIAEETSSAAVTMQTQVEALGSNVALLDRLLGKETTVTPPEFSNPNYTSATQNTEPAYHP